MVERIGRLDPKALVALAQFLKLPVQTSIEREKCTIGRRNVQWGATTHPRA